MRSISTLLAAAAVLATTVLADVDPIVIKVRVHRHQVPRILIVDTRLFIV